MKLSVTLLFLIMLSSFGLGKAQLAYQSVLNELRTDNSTETDSSNNNANSSVPLSFNNYLGNSENIHPKVLYFDQGWNGYEFWMAYTPYPLGVISAENPCIAVSHDGIAWITPSEDLNPLSLQPEEGYNSDTHLVYDKERDIMEIWWRTCDFQNKDKILRRKSTDGINWSEPEMVISYNQFNELVLSPAVWIKEGFYHLIYSNGRVLKYIKAKDTEDNLQWSEPEKLPINFGELHAWHQDVIINDEEEYELVVCAFGHRGNNNTADLYYVKLNKELDNATDPVLILHRGENENDFDHRSIYRSSMVNVNGLYYLYYSAIDIKWHRYMALSIGTSPFNLTGLTSIDPTDYQITLNERELILNKGERYQLTAENNSLELYEDYLKWKSSDIDVASVSENGVISTKTEGECIISAIYGSIKASCSVKVKGEAVVDILYSVPENIYQKTPKGIIPLYNEIPIKIYSLDGKMIKQTVTTKNEEIIIGNKGIYVIYYGENVAKIII